jgi:hypothetical protein
MGFSETSGMLFDPTAPGVFQLRMILPENRFPLSGIML